MDSQVYPSAFVSEENIRNLVNSEAQALHDSFSGIQDLKDAKNDSFMHDIYLKEHDYKPLSDDSDEDKDLKDTLGHLNANQNPFT